ncbi:MAG: hypothetical protein KF729_14860 [Sandaracinaceae bacterium]|nr:hypothetical protein [Sandaracinaceae bacterium]
MKALLQRSGPLSRLPFLGLGVALFGLKIGIDWAVARAFGQPYSVLYYVSPMDAPLMSPGGRETYWLAMWGVALPFIAIGVWLTLRRLMDARLPLWLVALFFVPFANLIFFLAVAVVPSRERDGRPSLVGYEPPDGPRRGMGAALLMAGAVGAVVSLGMVGLSVGLLGTYGAALFLGAPTLSAFVATLTFGHLHGPKAAPSFVAAMLALWIGFAVMVGFAIEGLVCLLMASPLAIASAVLGWALGFVMVRLAHEAAPRTASAAMILPLWLIAEVVSPQPAEPDRVVESVIEIDAPPEVVWNRVLAFEELPPPTELAFRMGVSAPTGAVIEGEGVGAVRRCRFTTGEFVEPITVWRPAEELSFDVAQMPDPMREMTPYDGPRPPHLDGYFATTRGQFLLERLPGERTRLRGRTWYELEVFPRAYWALFAEHLVHTIHLRVMRQIAVLSERDHAHGA